MDGLFGPLAKLALQPPLEMRLVQAQLQDAFQPQSLSGLAVQGVDVGRKYDQKVEALGRGHGMGSLHLYATMATLQHLGSASPLFKKCSDLYEADSNNIYRVVALMTYLQA